jgi:uncharacterized membrane protein
MFMKSCARNNKKLVGPQSCGTFSKCGCDFCKISSSCASKHSHAHVLEISYDVLRTCAGKFAILQAHVLGVALQLLGPAAFKIMLLLCLLVLAG